MTTGDQPTDHVPPHSGSAGKSKRSDLEENVTRRSTWVRLIFMIIIAVIWGLSRLVTAAVVVIQFFYVLLTAETNDQLKKLGHSLAIYAYEITDFLTFNSEVKPFPFDSDWPTEFRQDDLIDSEDD
jgi:hypothetical protein